MKKYFITALAMYLVMAACACGNNNTGSRSSAASVQVLATPESAVSPEPGVPSAQSEDKFIDFTVIQDDNNPLGSVVRFSDYVGKGKYILVDFWASWCGPCQREIPYIKAVYEKYKGDDFDVLSVAVWDKPADTEAAAKAHGVVWNQIVNAQDIPTKIYGIEGIPYLMLVSPDGEIVYRNCRGPQIEEVVSKYLGR